MLLFQSSGRLGANGCQHRVAAMQAEEYKPNFRNSILLLYFSEADMQEIPALTATRNPLCATMNPYIGTVNDRQVLYFDKAHYSGLGDLLPKTGWVLFAIADNEQISILDSLSKFCLDNSVLYICGAGEAASRIDDAFDLEVVDRKTAVGNENYSDVPMTTWHHDFDEGFWFAATLAYHETLPIDTVVCINLTEKNYQSRIADLISKINGGWLPED